MPKSLDKELDDAVLAFDLAGVGLCISRHWTIYRCNSEFSQIFGYMHEELKGHSIRRLYPSVAEFEMDGARYPSLMKQFGRVRDERIMRREDGSLFWSRITCRMVSDDDPAASMVWSVEDISANRPVVPALSTREREVARMVIAGKTSREIGNILSISPRTIDVHRARLMRKYSAKNLVDLIQRIRATP